MICFANLKGQTGGVKEVVYLKNGSIVKGIITEWVPNESISIQTADNSIFVFKINEIEKVKREITPTDDKKAMAKSPVKVSAYESNIALGYGTASGKYGLEVVCFNWVYGKNIHKKHFVGVGTGIRHFDQIDMTMVPILVDWRYRIDEGDISPYIRLSTGYSLNVSNGLDNSGFLVDPRIGFDFRLNNTILNIDFGYQTQQVAFITFKDPFNPAYFSKVYRFSEALKFSVGLSF
jgi:hypothetical protein